MDNIFDRQNDRELLLLQKAQQDKYTKAKKYFYPGLLLSIIGATIFTVLTSLNDLGLIVSLSSFFAITIFAANKYFSKKSSDLIEKAAKIQQTIDTALFQMPDNCHTLLPSEIADEVAAYMEEDVSPFKNWYSDYSGLDFQQQIFESQRENIRWSNVLSQKYTHLFFVCMIMPPIILTLWAIFSNITVGQFFAVFAWLFPLEQFFITHWWGSHTNSSTLEKINNEYSDIERYYNRYTTAEIRCKLCSLQNYIFEYRKNNLLIPDWFYKRHKNKMQHYEDTLASLVRKNRR